MYLLSYVSTLDAYVVPPHYSSPSEPSIPPPHSISRHRILSWSPFSIKILTLSICLCLCARALPFPCRLSRSDRCRGCLSHLILTSLVFSYISPISTTDPTPIFSLIRFFSFFSLIVVITGKLMVDLGGGGGGGVSGCSTDCKNHSWIGFFL